MLGCSIQAGKRSMDRSNLGRLPGGGDFEVGLGKWVTCLQAERFAADGRESVRGGKSVEWV